MVAVGDAMVEVVEEDQLTDDMVVAESCLLDNPARIGVYHRLGFDHQV